MACKQGTQKVVRGAWRRGYGEAYQNEHPGIASDHGMADRDSANPNHHCTRQAPKPALKNTN